MSEEKKKSIWSWIRWPLAIAVLALLVLPNLVSLKNLLQQGVNWQWLVAALGLRFLSLALTTVRWHLLLVGQSIRLPAIRVARMAGVGYVCNFVLPGTVGGDVAKASLIAKDTPDRRIRALATVPLDRILGLLAFLLLGTIAGLMQWSAISSTILRSTVLTMALLSGFGLAGLFVMLWVNVFRLPSELGVKDELETTSRLQQILQKLRRGIVMLRRARGTVVVALLLGLAGHVCLCSASYCCLRAFRAADLPLTWGDQLWLVPAAEVPAAFLSLPGGIGAREGALAYYYGEWAVDPSTVEVYRGMGVLVGGSYSLVCIALALLVGAALAVTGQAAVGESEVRVRA